MAEGPRLLGFKISEMYSQYMKAPWFKIFESPLVL